MSALFYQLIPTISLGLIALSFLFNIHKRSVSAFLTLMMVAISSNFIYYAYLDLAMLSILFFTIIIFIRAIVKPANDKWICRSYKGDEKRNTINKRMENGMV
ncbi:MAG: hypothetical protein Q9M40_07115 [Sulfurimonas sp.]|nr:hypothetical protein [Sulfurimonas sp.]MDQ7067744.1 hypothetical protein [Sulfurimonas sp.]